MKKNWFDIIFNALFDIVLPMITIIVFFAFLCVILVS